MSRDTSLDPRMHVAVDHRDPFLAAGITSLLSLHEDLFVERRMKHEQRVDVVVMDYETGLKSALTRSSIPGRSPASLIVTHRRAGWQVRRAVDAGIRGYLLQDCSADELTHAVRCVAAGRRYLSSTVAEHLMDALNYDLPTARQLEVLQLVALGLSNKEISRRLGIGERTVKTHVKEVLKKLGEKTRTAGTAEAKRRGMLAEMDRCVVASSAE